MILQQILPRVVERMCHCLKQTLVLSLMASILTIGCSDDRSLGDHECSECEPCETCVVQEDGEVACQAVENEYKQCGSDGHVHWFDSCDIDEGIADECSNAVCVDLSGTDAECECTNNWEGAECDECPDYWDPEMDCAQCLGNWDIEQNCEQCLENWDIKLSCEECVGNWDPNKNCLTCLGNWDIKKECETCLGNWDINEDCEQCLGNWDPQENCEQCLENWDVAQDCQVCLGNWDPDENCLQCLGNWDPKLDCSVCANNWIDEGNDCGTCPQNWDPATDCAQCQNQWIDEGNDCGTCPGNWDPSQDCNECYGNWDPEADCAVCLANWIDNGDDCGSCAEGWIPDVDECIEYCGNSIQTVGEECDDGNEIEWDGCNSCQIVEFQINTYEALEQSNPSVSMAPDAKFVVTWESNGQDGDALGVFGQIYGADGLPSGLEFQVNTYETSYQQSSSVSMLPDGSFTVVWISDDQNPSGWDVFSQRYNATGAPNGSEFQVNDITLYSHDHPSVAMFQDGKFVTVWDELQGSSRDDEIYGRYFDATATADGSDFLLNTYFDGYQQSPTVAVASDGSFAVAWTSFMFPGSSSSEVLCQRYDHEGAQDGVEFQVNTSDRTGQDGPSLGMASDGRFIVVWQSEGVFDSSRGIYGQRYGSDGSTDGVEFRIDTLEPIGSHGNPAVAMTQNGQFVAVWDVEDDFNSEGGVFGRFHNATGTPIGVEFQSNTYTTDTQVNPSVAVALDGRFVVVWESLGQDGDSTGIFGQRYDVNGNPLGLLPWDHYQ